MYILLRSNFEITSKLNFEVASLHLFVVSFYIPIYCGCNKIYHNKSKSYLEELRNHFICLLRVCQSSIPFNNIQFHQVLQSNANRSACRIGLILDLIWLILCRPPFLCYHSYGLI